MSALLISILAVTQLPGDPGSGKAPIPAGHELSKALALVKEVYGDKYAEAKTPEAKRVLAETLLEKVPGTTTPVNRYALLQVARDIAVNAGDGKTAFRAVDLLDRFFDVDAIKMKAAVLHSFSEQAKTTAEHLSVTEQTLLLADAAAANDDFPIANELVTLASECARRGRSASTLKQVTASQEKLKSLAKAYEKVAPALDVLKDRPDDADANLVVGTYRCFMKGEWDTGLPMLALGSDAILKDLAIEDFRPPSSSAEEAALGDRWWDFAKTAGASIQSGAQIRALHWYREALPGLSGLMKDKIEKRLTDADEGIPAEPRAYDVLALMKRADWELPRPWAWNPGGDGLNVFAKKNVSLSLPVAPIGDYDLRVSFTRRKGLYRVSVDHPVMSRMCYYRVSDENNRFAEWAAEDERGRRIPFKLSNGKKHTIDLAVRSRGEQAAIVVLMDGRPHLQWTGKLGTEGGRNEPLVSRLKLRIAGDSSYASHVEVHEVKLIMRTGKAMVTLSVE